MTRLQERPSADERRILRLAMPSARRLWPSIAMGLLSAICAVALLATSAYLLTRASEIIHILLLGIAIVGVRAFAIGRAVFRYVERLLGHDASFRQLAELRVGVLERLIPLAPAGLATHRRGDLLTRLVSDVDELQFLPLRVAQPLIIAGLTSTLAVVGIWLVSAPAAIVLALCLLLAGIVATTTNLAISGRADREAAPLRAALNDRIYETVSNFETLEAYGALDAKLAEVDAADARLRDALVSRARGSGAVAGSVMLFSGLATARAPAVGINPTVDGTLLAPMLTLIALVPMALFEIFAQVPQAVAAWRQVRASAVRVADVAPGDAPKSLPDAQLLPEPRQGPTRPVTLALDGVSAFWPGDPGPAIREISLELAPGDRLLVEGESGAGKTTLANVLVRFLDYEGSYQLNGVEAKEYAPAQVRGVVGLIEQRPHIFDETIRQNLLFAKPDADDAELEAVLRRVGLGAWLEERGGLEARVGEHGSLMSGGQAQRIALARGILADFPVLVLDEPTANVDPALADRLVAELLDASGAERSVVIISHTPVDPSLVTRALRLGCE
ncbi:MULTISPECIES: thiol reductant ABC exporter subunit CydC [unclassified Pseudoclavibacter]|uniref:thiol reductant ABC exporter subunit CydC n=1 Tax=unclassified Pseudoclavibacter TaxID=2615177 RepID=UPI001BABBE67|nr:thiol reductant ABC exporter subunit CydC [Pseudoclavibacter sp. Marseille-Q4354]MBS3179534.1 thiol reductant ABC exporter subunit CydC [Pseudoclavibacter sp. Marseille-Q4354]